MPSARRERLGALGHDAVVAPVMRSCARTSRARPARSMRSSSRAPTPAPRSPGSAGGWPVFAVGRRTAGAAAEAGFADVHVARTATPPRSRRWSSGRWRRGARLLHVAGRDRKPEPARALVAAGYPVSVWAAYAAEPVRRLPDAAGAALAAGALDAALHYSRRSTLVLLELVRTAGLEEPFLGLAHLCLSADVAAPLRRAGARRMIVAERPDEEALLAKVQRGGSHRNRRRTERPSAGEGTNPPATVSISSPSPEEPIVTEPPPDTAGLPPRRAGSDREPPSRESQGAGPPGRQPSRTSPRGRGLSRALAPAPRRRGEPGADDGAAFPEPGDARSGRSRPRARRPPPDRSCPDPRRASMSPARSNREAKPSGCGGASRHGSDAIRTSRPGRLGRGSGRGSRSRLARGGRSAGQNGGQTAAGTAAAKTAPGRSASPARAAARRRRPRRSGPVGRTRRRRPGVRRELPASAANRPAPRAPRAADREPGAAGRGRRPRPPGRDPRCRAEVARRAGRPDPARDGRSGRSGGGRPRRPRIRPWRT